MTASSVDTIAAGSAVQMQKIAAAFCLQTKDVRQAGALGLLHVSEQAASGLDGGV